MIVTTASFLTVCTFANNKNSLIEPYQHHWWLGVVSSNRNLYTIGCGRFLPCILPPAPLVLSDLLSDYPVCTLPALILEYTLPQS